MLLQDLKSGMRLENTNTTILVDVKSVGQYGFTAKEIGNCQGRWDGSTGDYSLASLEAGSWKIAKV